MTQYDAGPGDWSNREWEDPERKPVPHARRRGPTLPPWALLAIVVGILIVLCVAVVLGLRALRNRVDTDEPTAAVTATRAVVPIATWTPAPGQTQPTLTPSPTVELPSVPGATQPPFTQIAPGATVVVQNTGGQGLNVRAEPTTGAALVANIKEGTALVVIEGPQEANGYVWWKLRLPDGKEGWGAAEWLALQTSP